MTETENETYSKLCSELLRACEIKEFVQLLSESWEAARLYFPERANAEYLSILRLRLEILKAVL